MFQTVRIRLVILNTTVFLCVLALLGSFLYFYTQHRMLSEVDQSLLTAANRIRLQQDRNAVRINPNERAVDRRIVYLLWDAKGNLIGQFPDQSVYDKDVQVFQPNSYTQSSFKSIELDNHSYRVMTVPVEIQASQLTRLGIVTYSATSVVELVRSIDPEQDMLDNLLGVTVICGVIGGAITILIGLFLAGRALVPIRISWEKQQQFVADASHELRTPLAVMQTHAELLLRHPDRTIQEESRHISVILKEAKRISKLVSDLLTLARTDSNQLQIDKKPFLLNHTVDDVTEPFHQLAELKQIDIIIENEHQIEILGDEERIRQLLVVLLDNAIKYTPAGGKINISCKRYPHEAEIVVQDTGIGIAKQDLPFIFDRFYRGDKVRTRSEGGNGLGLSIAKWIVEAHKGNIRVESELGKGTVFRITFPIGKA
ncbi:sensor histidine kinase [Effusibacillus dendaii]|uniref:histidine kinase n=1 Tax=Effusibacillus dendaii TaxID=2743772 RepID=A0A7I8D828_9BACL|nr:ATP-binding protein [Effusibacillus dendaii]BCJ85159.1 two-component sensor histidine kinase [Effusibacillus dendaii]